jgi:hypothetical protein
MTILIASRRNTGTQQALTNGQRSMPFSAVERDNTASCICPAVPVPGKVAVINPVAIEAVTDVKTTQRRNGWTGRLPGYSRWNILW